jgi:uncharacterized protein with gpF-like domain
MDWPKEMPPYAYPEKKQRVSKTNARKELIEQNRIRKGFERTTFRNLISAFRDIGEVGSRFYRENNRVPDDSENWINARITNVLRPIYQSVTETFAGRFETYQKQEQSQFDTIFRTFLLEFGAKNIRAISDVTRAKILRAILDAQEQDFGQEETARVILARQTDIQSKRRARTIARTEVHNAASFASHTMAKNLPIPNLKKRWVAVTDNRTRTGHSQISGTTVDLDADFNVPTEFSTGIVDIPMGYPSDPRGGARNVINCRCVLVYVTDDEDDVV